MAYTREDLRAIYNRTSGRCHICGKVLALINYGMFGEKGAWEVEHSNARARGGTDRLNNLYAACITCNRRKGTVTTRTARRWEGRKSAPLSKEKAKVARTENAVLGGGAGFFVGAALGGTPLGLLCLLVGAAIGHDVNPQK